MKTPHLHQTDLINAAALAQDCRRRKLEQVKAGNPFWGYDPLRRNEADLFNCTTDLFGPLKPADWQKIASNIGRMCHHPDQLKHNMSVAKSLYDYVQAKHVVARKTNFLPFSIGHSQKIVCWSPLILFVNERPIIPFVDPRLENKLTSAGRRFAFSIMHQRIRVSDPDYAGVDLGIFQFTKHLEVPSARNVDFLINSDAELISFSEIDEAISDVLIIWNQLFSERERSKRASGGRGTLI